MSMVGVAATIPTMTGTRSGIPTEAGEARPGAGVILSQSQTGLTFSDLARGLFFDVGGRAHQKISAAIRRIALAVSGMLRVRSRVSAICFTRVALP
jgi:hypothetical protein